MSLLETPTKYDAQKVLRMQIGMMSPIWLPVAGAAAMGLAAWSFTRWMRLASPQGAAEFKTKADEAVAEVQAAAEPVVAAVEKTVVEAAEPLAPAPAPEPAPSSHATGAAVAKTAEKPADPPVETAVPVKAAKPRATKADPKIDAISAKKSVVRKARATAH